MQEAQREQFATLTLNTAVELTAAALSQVRGHRHARRAGDRDARRHARALPRGGRARERRPPGLHARVARGKPAVSPREPPFLLRAVGDRRRWFGTWIVADAAPWRTAPAKPAPPPCDERSSIARSFALLPAVPRLGRAADLFALHRRAGARRRGSRRPRAERRRADGDDRRARRGDPLTPTRRRRSPAPTTTCSRGSTTTGSRRTSPSS